MRRALVSSGAAPETDLRSNSTSVTWRRLLPFGRLSGDRAPRDPSPFARMSFLRCARVSPLGGEALVDRVDHLTQIRRQEDGRILEV